MNTLPADVRLANITHTAITSMPTRRAFIGGAGSTAVLAATPVVASAMPVTLPLERHWQSRCEAFRTLWDEPDVDEDAAFERIAAAEIAILNSLDTSPRAIELRLWIAWSHTDTSNVVARVGTKVAQGDVAGLLRIRPHLDMHEKMLFAAILNLRGEG